MTENVLGDRESEQKALVESRESATSRLSRLLAQHAQDRKSAQVTDAESQQFTGADGQESGAVSSSEPHTSIQQALTTDNVGLATEHSHTDSAAQASSTQPPPASNNKLADPNTSAASAVVTSATRDTYTRPTSSTLDTSFGTSPSDLGAAMPNQVAAEKRAEKSGNHKTKKSRKSKNKNKNKNKATVPSEEGSQIDTLDNPEQLDSSARPTSASSDGNLVDPAAEDTNTRLQAASGEQVREIEPVGANSHTVSGAKGDAYPGVENGQSSVAAYDKALGAEHDTSTSANPDTASDAKHNTISDALPDITQKHDQVSPESETTTAVPAASLSKLNIDQPEEQVSVGTMRPRTPEIEHITEQKSEKQSESSNAPSQPQATEQGTRARYPDKLPTITEEDETTPTKEQVKTVKEAHASTSDATDPERTPRPTHATLSARPAAPAQAEEPEAACEVFRFDNFHPETKCRNPECRKATHPLDGSTRVCPACGPRSKVRYCSRPCLYKDVRRHFMNECGTLMISGPIDENSLCTDNNARRPYIRHATEQMVNTVERHRQAVWYATEAVGEYFIFDDVEVCESANPTKEEVQEVRGLGECIFAVFVPEDVERVFRRALVSSLTWGATPLNTVNSAALAGMVMEVLKSRGEWDRQMCTNLCMQMGFELGYQIPLEAQVW